MTVTCNVPGCGRVWPRDPCLEVACPTCQAPVGQRCKRPSGHRCDWHAERDLLADREGHYGTCPFGKCSKAPKYATEPTEQGNQYVMPGCEKDRSRGPRQMDMF
jgi:hypothetical protein